MLDLDLGLLPRFLVWIVTLGGAGFLAFWVWEHWVEMLWPKAKELVAWAKRWLVLAIASVLSIGAYFLLLWLGLEKVPATPQDWLTTLFAVIATTYLSSQQFHGHLALSKPKEVPQ